MSDLKPCPFCGGPANGVVIMTMGAVMCDDCGYALDRNNPLLAIAAWNTRAPDSNLSTAMKLLRDNKLQIGRELTTADEDVLRMAEEWV